MQRGDQVRAGETLYTLDADAQVLAREAAAARSLSADKQADDLRHGKRPSELQAIRAQLAQARAALANSTAALERNQRLVTQGFVAPLTQDALVAARASDAARVHELQANLVTAELAARSDQIAAAAAAAQGSRADLDLARWQELQMQRNAPGDAFVYDVMYRVGEWVPAGAPVIALLPPGAVKVRFFVPEPALATLAVGQTVAVSCDGCSAGLSAARELHLAAGRVHAAGDLQRRQPRQAGLHGRGAAAERRGAQARPAGRRAAGRTRVIHR